MLERLGKGGFGQVWRVRNKLDGLDYAVKSVRIKPGQDVSKTLREVNTLSRLHNGHIVRYYNAWIEGENASSSELKRKWRDQAVALRGVDDALANAPSCARLSPRTRPSWPAQTAPPGGAARPKPRALLPQTTSSFGRTVTRMTRTREMRTRTSRRRKSRARTRLRRPSRVGPSARAAPSPLGVAAARSSSGAKMASAATRAAPRRTGATAGSDACLSRAPAPTHR